MDQPPEAVRKIIRAITDRYLSKCHQQGVALEDFYAALLKIKKEHPEVGVSELYKRTFQRIKQMAN